ncbi:kinase-like domain-containing protein [Dipodascopsis uninucleata]
MTTPLLRDHYDALELIGRGTFGRIRKVQHRGDGHILVRKEISYCRMSQREKNQLLAELRILKALRHPNIVQYVHHERVQDSEEVHLYMEYCGGGDLAQLIKACRDSGQFVPERVIWSIFTQLLLALYRCHYGIDPPPLTDIFAPSDESPPSATTVILHRDIKPENIFLDAENSVKLGDFGLSKMLDPEHSLATTYVGTPYYMSPEVLLDQPYTPQSDIWSLGCVLYELCALQPPFAGKSHMQLAQKIREGRFAPLPQGYSPALQRIVAACLSLQAQKRPTTHILLQNELVRMHRREREMVEMHKILLKREESLETRECMLSQREQDMQQTWEAEQQRYEANLKAKLQEELENVFHEAVENRAREMLENHLQEQLHLHQQRRQQEQQEHLEQEQNQHLTFSNDIENHNMTFSPKSPLISRHSMSDLRQLYNDKTVTASPADIAMSYSPFPSASPLGTFPGRTYRLDQNMAAAVATNRTPTRTRLMNVFSSEDLSSPTSPLSPTASASTATAATSTTTVRTMGMKRKASENQKSVVPLRAIHENVEFPQRQAGTGLGLGAALARAKIESSRRTTGRSIIDIQRDCHDEFADLEKSCENEVNGNGHVTLPDEQTRLWLMNQDTEEHLNSPFLRRATTNKSF